jgi:glycerol uptake facilitator-like aquaporin
MNAFELNRRLFAELLGTAILVATVVGSGIMGVRLSAGNDAIALLGNTLATGAILAVLILILAPVSGAHFNPAVTIALSLRRIFPAREIAPYVAVQVIGGLLGMLAAHFMFELDAYSLSTTVRTGVSQWVSEVVAAFGLVATILGCIRFRPAALPYAVALFISAGYWFTSSTSFANPAVAIARSFTDTFSGIRPVDVPAFIAAEIIGAVLAAFVFSWLLKPDSGDK